jgi:fatty acid CoA ligase FadD36
LSRGELVEAAAAVANEIAGANAVAIDAVASLETIVAVVACLMAGTPAVPVPPDSGPIERGHILKDSGAVLILGAAREEVVTIPSVPVDVRARSSATQREPDDRSTAFIMYTSGTTGLPKGVVLSASATPSKPAATAVRRLPHRRGRSRAGHP